MMKQFLLCHALRQLVRLVGVLMIVLLGLHGQGGVGILGLE